MQRSDGAAAGAAGEASVAHAGAVEDSAAALAAAREDSAPARAGSSGTPVRDLSDQELAHLRGFAVRSAIRFGSTPADAEDIAQAVLESLIRQPDVPDSPRAWVRTAVRNKVIDADRHRKLPQVDADGGRGLREVALEPAVGSGDGEEWKHQQVDQLRIFVERGLPVSRAGMRPELLRSIWELLGARLSKREMEVLALTQAGHSQQEIAEILGFASANSVKVTLSRIRRKVADLEGELAHLRGHPRPY